MDGIEAGRTADIPPADREWTPAEVGRRSGARGMEVLLNGLGVPVELRYSVSVWLKMMMFGGLSRTSSTTSDATMKDVGNEGKVLYMASEERAVWSVYCFSIHVCISSGPGLSLI
jgi:hypothetical protein